jgi:hypothetical protein
MASDLKHIGEATGNLVPGMSVPSRPDSHVPVWHRALSQNQSVWECPITFPFIYVCA